jgi:hypothetical protein
VIRLGIVDCDTSHVVAFTRRLRHVDVALGEWADGRLTTVRAVRGGAPVGLTELGLTAVGLPA